LCFISVSIVLKYTERTVERTSGEWPLLNKFLAAATVPRHIENAPCYDDSHKNVFRCSSVASQKILGAGAKYFKIKAATIFGFGTLHLEAQNHKIS